MSGDNLSDDYVAKLLKNDAKANSSQYRSLGVGAFLPTRQTGQAPKPNLRFLRNILRETDNHNSALLAKEAEDSRKRFLQHERQNDSSGSREEYCTKGHDGRSRNRDKRKRSIGEISGESDRRSSHTHERSVRSRDRKHEGKGRHSRRREREESEARSEDLPVGHPRSHRRRRRRSNSSRSDEDRRERRRNRSKDRENSKRHSNRSLSPDRSRKRRRRDNPTDRRNSPRRDDRDSAGADRKKRSKPYPEVPSVSDSDPLEMVIGPQRPSSEKMVKRRGRGHDNGPSAMDSHFANDYDPSADVRINSDEEDDWDQALEALRDRQRWKQQGAERLKAAGFTDEEIGKWEKGGEKGEADVRWATRGEGREWDRGKAVDRDGQITQHPEWGRLKGT